MSKSYKEVAAVIIRVQSLGILVFALVTLFGAITTKEIDNQATLMAEMVIYSIFIIVMWLIARGLINSNSRAFGPFVLSQLFVGIVAWPLITEGQISTRIVGVVAGVSVLVSLYLVFSKKFRTEFFEN